MARRSAATLQDVADLAGVSRGTASRALSGEGRVSAGTRDRVRSAAAELRFATNSGARNLRRARAGSIGLWLPPELRFMEYYMDFTFGVVESTTHRELTVSLIPADFPAAKAHALHVDGCVMADVTHDDPLAAAILDSGMPVVTSELAPSGMPAPMASIVADHDDAVRRILDLLRAGGARCVAVLIPAVEQSWVQAVRAATLRWAERAGIEVALVELHGVPLADELRRIVAAALAERPDVDAVLCVPDGLAVGVLSALQELGRVVPDDLQLVSYVDGATMPIVQPPITALDLRPREAGLRAGSLLVSLLDGGATAGALGGPRREPLELALRRRGTTR